MIKLSPLPDELDRSHLGRLMRFNGLRTETEIANLMAKSAHVEQSSRREICCLDLLSRTVQMSLPQYVCRHTTLPFRRSFTSYLPDLAHGCAEDQSMLRLTGMRVARPGAYLCVDCVKSDLKHYGMSYWRRDHQLPGVALCTKHMCALRYVDTRDAFLDAPSRFLTDSHLVDSNWAKLVQQSTGVQRFLEISRELLDRQKPFDVKTIRIVLRDRAHQLGLCTYGDNPRITKSRIKKHLLSDVVLENFPRQWLLTVFPILADKKHGIKLNQMDGVLYMSTSASSVSPYILACCVLFESAEEAINALLAHQPESTVRRTSTTDQRIDPEELRTAYIREKGQHSSILKEFPDQKRAVLAGLEESGLPNLVYRKNQSILEAVTAFFLHKKSLSKSAELGGIAVETLEQVIRQAGNNFTLSLVEMCGPQGGPGTGVLRIKPKTPIEAGATIVTNTPKQSQHEFAD